MQATVGSGRRGRLRESCGRCGGVVVVGIVVVVVVIVGCSGDSGSGGSGSGDPDYVVQLLHGMRWH